MSVWPSKYVTIFDFCAALVVQWSVGAEGSAPSAQRASGVAVMPQQESCACKGEVGPVPTCPPALPITGTTTAIPHRKDGRG